MDSRKIKDLRLILSKPIDNVRYPKKYLKSSSHFQVARIIRNLCVLSEKKPFRILDIGCSTAELYDSVKSDSLKYTGIEPFEEDAKRARSKGLQIYGISAESVLVLKEDFELIVFSDVLEHCVSSEKVLTDSKNFLQMEGM